MATKSPNDILKEAILLERRGKAFYSNIARQTESEAVRKVFNMMAEEEDEHIEFLSRQFKAFNEKHEFLRPEAPQEHPDEEVVMNILTKEIREQISAASFEAAAISAAIDFETRAVNIYSERAEQASDPMEKETYRMLAEWESGHHKLLYRLNEDLKEQIWNDNSFWPF
ncbi:MAG: ferritin family protein [Bacteroidales bacterium]|nr:ferritin family protein [Bacteroidales bacterium]